MTRMSQASHGLWHEDTDDGDEDQDSGPEFVFNPVESDEEFDDVVTHSTGS